MPEGTHRTERFHIIDIRYLVALSCSRGHTCGRTQAFEKQFGLEEQSGVADWPRVQLGTSE